MDLVSSTLDKYLRHRFNGTVSHSRSTTSDPTELNNPGTQSSSNTAATGQDDTEEKTTITDNGQQPDSAIHDMNDSTSDICEPIEIHTLSFHKIAPCCVALHKSLRYIAAGFENSQIYLWTVIHSGSRDLARQNNQTSPNQSTQEPAERTDAAHDCVAGIECPGDEVIRLGDMSRLTAHSGSIYSIEFVQDNDLMLSCSEDTTIRMWCIQSKCNLVVYRGHNYPIWSIAVSPRGDYFASASMDTTARLWTFDKMCPLRIFCGHEDDVECVKFHPNSKYIATGSSDTTVRLWTISDGRMVRLMVGHKGAITSLSFFPDGKFLASSSCDGSIKVWNLATNSVTNHLTVPALRTISFSPTHEFASSCGGDNILRICNVEGSSIVQKKAHKLDDKFTKLFTSHFLTDNTLFISGLAKPVVTQHSPDTDDTQPASKLKTH